SSLFVFFFFFLLLSPSLHSTLFPYTTLFRSAFWVFVYVIGRVRKSRPQQLDLIGDRREEPGGSQAFDPDSRHGKCDRDLHQETLDRKSTRLNSSHLGISYAVFCLKKKKKKKN